MLEAVRAIGVAVERHHPREQPHQLPELRRPLGAMLAHHVGQRLDQVRVRHRPHPAVPRAIVSLPFPLGIGVEERVVHARGGDGVRSPEFTGIEQMPPQPVDVPGVHEIGREWIEAYGGLHAGGPRRPPVHVEEQLRHRVPHLFQDGAPRAARGLAPASDVRRCHPPCEPLQRPQQPVAVHGDVHAFQPHAALPAGAVRFGIDRLIA